MVLKDLCADLALAGNILGASLVLPSPTYVDFGASTAENPIMSFDGTDTYTIEVWKKAGVPPYFEFNELDYVDTTNCPITYTPLVSADYDP